MDEQFDMDFEAERYEDGSFHPATIKISFQNSLLNHRLGVYGSLTVKFIIMPLNPL